MNDRNLRYLRTQRQKEEQQKLIQDALLQDGITGGSSAQAAAQLIVAQQQGQQGQLSATQLKIRKRREEARVANQAALAMTAVVNEDGDEMMEIASIGNGTTLGRPRVFSSVAV